MTREHRKAIEQELERKLLQLFEVKHTSRQKARHYAQIVEALRENRRAQQQAGRRNRDRA